MIIGPQWLASDGDGRLRLDKPDDPVRVEIETAFRREIRVIPLVVDGATMPGLGSSVAPGAPGAERHEHHGQHGQHEPSHEQYR